MGLYRRGRTWWVRFQWDNQEIRQSARTTDRAEALEFEAKLRGDLRRIGRGGKARVSYRDAMERFVLEYLPELTQTSQTRYLTSARSLHSHFENLYLDEITRTKILDFVTKRKRDGVKAAGINRDLACLSSMLTKAADWELIDANPMMGMRGLRQTEPEGRLRYLTHDEFERLCQVSSDRLRPLIVFAVETGLRFEEQFSLTWNQVDLKRGEIHLVRTKNGTRRTVPLEPAAIRVLKSQPRHLKAPWVFWHDKGERYRTLRESFGTAVKNAGINDFTWHDLRHTFASWKAQAGIDMYKLQQLLGHKRPEMTQRYAHLRTADLKAELKRVRTKSGTHTKDRKTLRH